MFDCQQCQPSTLNRRDFLQRAGAGFGMLGLQALLGREGLLASDAVSANPLSPRLPHFPGKAKSVIFLFMYGGPSQVDTFDYKPALEKHHGQKIDKVSFGTSKIDRIYKGGSLMKSPFGFDRHGESGLWVCDQYPHIASVIDDIAVIKSVYAESNNHAPALFQLNTGMTRVGFPSVGSWVTYGIGTENQDMPGFVVMYDYRGGPIGGPQNWGSGFLPSTYQATPVRSKGTPILNLSRSGDVSAAQQREQLDLMKELNQQHSKSHPAEADLLDRIETFELAYRMQSAAPELIDISKETEKTKQVYGIEPNKRTAYFGTQCLMARRLVERGVRFVQLYSGGGHGDNNWDAHGNIIKNHKMHCYDTDKPIAGLITDLKNRGLLDETLIVWGGEFGRTPQKQGGGGRDHHPEGFCMFMAGGGIKGGVSYGETDEVGYHAAVDRTSVNDIHATILHMLGIDHKQLTFAHRGRRFRLTDVSGEPIRKIMA